MKHFLIFFLLLFSSSVFAEDISDFQIEGMSIGESLLDYYSEDFILENTKTYNTDGKFLYFEDYEGLKTYYAIAIIYKKNDNQYKIYSVTGAINYDDKIEECYQKQNEVMSELSNLLNIKKWDGEPWKDYEGSYNMKYKNLDTGENIQVYCSEWVEESNNFDSLRVAINSQEAWKWINSQ